ncbi:hypothetical protein EMIT0P171_10178 [Pseudomonas sp. IT-P171]
MASKSFVGNGHGYAVSTWHAKGKKIDFLVLKQSLNQQAGDAREASALPICQGWQSLAVL